MIINLCTEKRIIYFYQRIHDTNLFFLCHLFDQTFVYFCNIPMRRYRISAIRYIVKYSIWDFRFFYKIFAYPVNIVTMINICQIIDFLQPVFTKPVYNISSLIFCFSCNITNQTTYKK